MKRKGTNSSPTMLYYFFKLLLGIVRQTHIMCEDEFSNTLDCTNDGNVSEIHKAYVGQDTQELFKCVSYGVSNLQESCLDYLDKTKENKWKCDGGQSCILSPVNVTSCTKNQKYFRVVISCKNNETEGRVAFD